MARPREGDRVLGPYRHGEQWRLILVDGGGKKTRQSYATEAEAYQVRRDLLRALESEAQLTVEQVMERYELHLKTKGNKPGSIVTTLFRLRSFFGAAKEQRFSTI